MVGLLYITQYSLPKLGSFFDITNVKPMSL